jgi:hypothetical protein
MQSTSPIRLRRAPHVAGARSRPMVAGAGATSAVVIALGFFFAVRPSSATASDLVRFVGRFHTLAVHLPIGVLLLIATAEALTIVMPRRAALRERVDSALLLALPFLVASMVSRSRSGSFSRAAADTRPGSSACIARSPSPG